MYSMDCSETSSNEKIVLIGGGGHAKSVIDSLLQRYSYEQLSITDRDIRRGTKVCGVSVFGDDGMLSELYDLGYIHAVIGVGSIKFTSIRRKVWNNARSIGFIFPPVTDASSIIAKSAKLCDGVYVGKKAVINSDSVVGKFAIINTGAIIEHECRIGEFSHIAVGATICGGCTVENDVFIGANSTVIQGVRIGMNSVIGAGSIVLADVPAGTTVIGMWGGQRLGNKSLHKFKKVVTFPVLIGRAAA